MKTENIYIAKLGYSTKIDKKGAVVFFEIDVRTFEAIGANEIKYAEASKFPSIDVDVTFITETYAPIANAIAKVNSPLIKREKLVGTYEDEAGKTISTRLTFSDSERTLTKEEVMKIVDEIVAELKANGIEMKL